MQMFSLRDVDQLAMLVEVGAGRFFQHHRSAALEGEPSLINEDAMGKGWIAKIRLSDPAELNELMDEAAYQDFLKPIA